MTIRLAAVFSHPIQYFAPLFRALAADPALELKVFFRSLRGAEGYHDPGFDRSVAWDVPVLEGYDHELLAPGASAAGRLFGPDHPQVATRLAAFDPDAVWVHGYASLASLRAILWGRGRGVVFTGDSELLQPRSTARRALKRGLLPYLFRRVSVFVDYGERNRDYYRHYGVPDAKMVHGGYPLDVVRFAAGRDAMDDGQRQARREELGLTRFAPGDEDRRAQREALGLPPFPGAMTVVWAGKLVAMKRPLDLVEAIAMLAGRGVEVQALVIGSGPLEEQLRERIAASAGGGRAALAGRVALAGFVNQAAMPGMLALGDVVAMTSEREPYGLVIPEAMAAGCAVVASDRVGCVSASGVARPGVNTLVYPCGVVPALAAALGAMARDPDGLAAMQRASRELAWQQDVSRIAVAMREAALRAARRRRR
jgi:glycosyltransferase involved in cell wall biosynthesis